MQLIRFMQCSLSLLLVVIVLCLSSLHFADISLYSDAPVMPYFEEIRNTNGSFNSTSFQTQNISGFFSSTSFQMKNISGFFSSTSFQMKNISGFFNSTSFQMKNNTLEDSSTLRKPNIAIAIMMDENYRSIHNFSLVVKRLECYCESKGYTFLNFDPDKVEGCLEVKNFLIVFRRHCFIAEYLENHNEIDYIMGMDYDYLVVNPNIGIEQFIQPGVNIVFNTRFHNNEIAIGSYLVRNTEWSRNFLHGLSQMQKKMPTGGFRNRDNGSLHIYLLGVLRPQATSQYTKCYEAWRHSVGLPTYDMYVRCVQTALGPPRNWGNVSILHRGHGWFVDRFVLKENYGGNLIFLHGVKDSGSYFVATGENINALSCNDLRLSPKVQHLSSEVFTKMMLESDVDLRRSRPTPFNNHYISNCLPHCKQLNSSDSF